MRPSLFRFTAMLQLALVVFMSTGCSPTQPFYLNESPDLEYYLNSANRIDYPDVDTAEIAKHAPSAPPLTIYNHDYKFWDLTLEECTAIALQNTKIFTTTGGNAATRQNVASQIISAGTAQLSSIYDVAIQESTTQSVPITVDGAGNRTLPRGATTSNQVGGVEDALAEFDMQASSFFSLNTTDRPRNTGIANTVNPPISQATDVTQQLALSKRFATGGVATLRQQTIYSRNNVDVTGNFARSTPSDYTFLLEAQVQHPLMRNRGTMVNRIPVVLASLNTDIEIVDLEIQTRNLVRDVENAYWNLYVAYRAVSTAIVGRNTAQTTAYFAQKLKEGGTGTVQELAQARGQYYDFRRRLEASLGGSSIPGLAQQGVYELDRELRRLMGLEASDGRLIRPIDEPTVARVDFDFEQLRTSMLYLSPELRQTRFEIKQRELELISAKNQILPDINWSMTLRGVGVGDTLGPPGRRGIPAPAEGSSAMGEFTSGDWVEFATRMDILPNPNGSRRAMARIRSRRLQQRLAEEGLKEKERLLVSQMQDAIGRVYSHYQQTQTSASLWAEAEKEVTARLRQYEAGQSEINVVLQSQQRRADAEINYYRALAEYNRGLNEVDYLQGTSLVNNGITLAEGPWDDAAYWDALQRARERSAGWKLQYGVTRPGVVRQGPVASESSVPQIVGSGVSIDPETLNPVPLEAPQGNIETPSTALPLSEMGNSTREVFGDVPQLFDNTPENLDAAPGTLDTAPEIESAPQIERAPAAVEAIPSIAPSGSPANSPATRPGSLPPLENPDSAGLQIPDMRSGGRTIQSLGYEESVG
ncbi:MAG: TolC family protein, partial [Planctomycetota bacterium]